MAEEFKWPEGIRAALTLTFDDARPSQLDSGIPILNEYDTKGTFYVSFSNMDQRLDEWRQALAGGHEIGNHTVNHPCSGNFSFAHSRALENYTLHQMEEELTGANQHIEETLGVTPKTFAYPCGQKFIGRGESVQSYVPLIAEHFLLGRGFKNECHQDPIHGDLAQAMGVDFDRMTVQEFHTRIETALNDSGWLILAGHNVSSDNGQTVLEETLHAICEYANDPANGVWLDTAAAIGEYVVARQESDLG